MERLSGFAALPAPAAYPSLAPGAKWAEPIARLRGVAGWLRCRAYAAVPWLLRRLPARLCVRVEPGSSGILCVCARAESLGGVFV